MILARYLRRLAHPFVAIIVSTLLSLSAKVRDDSVEERPVLVDWSSPTRDRQAAEIAVFVLQQNVADSDLKNTFWIFADTDNLAEPQVVERLASAPKPLICRLVSANDRMGFSCAPMSSTDAKKHIVSAALMWTEWERRLANFCTDSDDRIVIHHADRSLESSLGGLRQWIKDYRILHTLILDSKPTQDVCASFTLAPAVLMEDPS